MKTIALYDFNWHGHHPSYLQIFAGSLLRDKFRVILFCQHPEKIVAALGKVLSPEQMSRIEGHRIQYPPGNGSMVTALVQSFINWRQAADDLTTFQNNTGRAVDFVLFLKVEDYCRGVIPLTAVRRHFAFRWGGLFIHLDLPRQARMNLFSDRRLLLRHSLKSGLHNFSVFNLPTCRFVGTLQEDCIDDLKSAITTEVVHFPETTFEATSSESPLVRRVQEMAQGRKIVALLGVMDRRKGIFTFIDMARRCQERNWFFTACGEAKNFWTSPRDLEALQEAIASCREGNILIHPEKIADEAELNALIKLSDALFCVYENFPPYSSNFLTKAALFRKPVIVGKYGLLEKRVLGFGTGKPAIPGDAGSCIQALDELFSRGLENPQFAPYYQRNSAKYFDGLLASLMERCLKGS